MGGDGSTGHKLIIHKLQWHYRYKLGTLEGEDKQKIQRKGCNQNFKNYFLGELPVEISSSKLQVRYGPKQ